MGFLRRRRRLERDEVAAGEAPGTRGGAGAGTAIVAGGAAVAGGLLRAIARLVALATLIAVGLIVAAIVLRVLDANARNAIVSDIHDAGRWLTGPFGNMFSIKDAKESIAVNWGIPAVVYLAVGTWIASMLRRASLGPLAVRDRGFARRRRGREAPVA